MSSSKEPTAEEATALFEKLEQKFPSKTLSEERWYLVAVSLALATYQGSANCHFRLPLSLEAVNPNLPEICTNI